MILTTSSILQMKPVLERVLLMDMPVKYSYQFARIVKELDNELVIFESEKQKLIKECCEIDENGEVKLKEKEINGQQYPEVVFKSDCENKFHKDIQDLLNTEIDIKISPVDISNLDILLSVEDVLIIEPLLKM